MNLFAVWARDAPGMEAARLRVREAHRARLRAPGAHAVEVLAAGPTTGGPAGGMNGTLLVVRASSADEVRRFVEEDPYVHAGVYASVDVQPWRCGLGPPAWTTT
ncbi:MAG: YciI family protein [Piscinibacter sp.]|nr:YciI family protein [Piscinibacter sp.]